MIEQRLTKNKNKKKCPISSSCCLTVNNFTDTAVQFLHKSTALNWSFWYNLISELVKGNKQKMRKKRLKLQQHAIWMWSRNADLHKNKLKLETMPKSFYLQQPEMKEAFLLQSKDSKVNVTQKRETVNNKLRNQIKQCGTGLDNKRS